jgi:hypothetical protein
MQMKLGNLIENEIKCKEMNSRHRFRSQLDTTIDILIKEKQRVDWNILYTLWIV